MKKWLIGLLVFVLLLVTAIYIFIPYVIHINHSVPVRVTEDGLNRNLCNYKNWGTWWPGTSLSPNDTANTISYLYNDYTYSAKGNNLNPVFVSIAGKGIIAKTSLIIIPETDDSMKLVWEGLIPTSYDPIKRLRIYFGSNKIDKDIDTILQRIQSHFSNPTNIYGFKIEKKLVVDSLLVYTSIQSKEYPSNDLVYSLVNKLKNYISKKAALETGYPMLNINKKDSITWVTRVAIPVNRNLESSDDILSKRMLGRGNILVLEIKGGPATIDNAFRQAESYVNDYHLSSPAIPFQSLVTDRLKETDTSKWITRIYYPVM